MAFHAYQREGRKREGRGLLRPPSDGRRRLRAGAATRSRRSRQPYQLPATIYQLWRDDPSAPCHVNVRPRSWPRLAFSSALAVAPRPGSLVHRRARELHVLPGRAPASRHNVKPFRCASSTNSRVAEFARSAHLRAARGKWYHTHICWGATERPPTGWLDFPRVKGASVALCLRCIGSGVRPPTLPPTS